MLIGRVRGGMLHHLQDYIRNGHGKGGLPAWASSYGEQGGHMAKLAKQFATRDPVHPEGMVPPKTGNARRGSLPG